MIDRKNVFDHLKNLTTRYVLGYPYFKENYKFIAIYSSI